MKKFPVILFIYIAAGSLFLVRCKKDEVIPTPPVASFTIAPGNGQTTTIFQFDAVNSKTTNPGDTILFLRWDWDNDDVWDTGFSRAKKFTHRYYKPGTYSPRLEVRNEAGMSDTIRQTVTVAQGNSAPQPSFTLTPGSGNIRTVFVLDASATRDDEDSLNTLQLRWDFNGDNYFDTPYSNELVYNQTYSSAGIYNITLNVLDPHGLTSNIKKTVNVSISNPDLVPQFVWTPEKPTTSDTVQFDASSSYDPAEPANTFQYRWNFNKDDEFDTEYLDNPIVGHRFTVEGENQVILEIRDKYGLINQVMQKIWILHSNQAPTASFFTGYDYGNLTTSFYFDGGGVSDPEDYIDQLKVRWDFTSDGTWDTDFAKEKTITHKYAAPGTYRIKMQVTDSGGLSDTTSQTVFVSSGTNETGLIIDKTKGIYYGTVKIGNQWWMAENLNEPSTGKYCYSNKQTNCDLYGGLYSWTIAMGNVTTEKAKGLCPTGWHIPTLTEWQQLVDFFGPANARARLEVAGDSDFRMFYAGQRSINHRYEFLNTVSNFWTSTKSSGSNAWMMSFQFDKDEAFKLNLGWDYGMSVRCVKD